MGGELQDGPLTVGTGRDNADIGGVVNGGNDASCENNLLPGEDLLGRAPKFSFSIPFDVPGLANVDDIDTVGASLPQVRGHVH